VAVADWLPVTLGLLAWAVVSVAVRVASRPRAIEPAPPSQDLPGDEPPAVVAMLVDDWEVGEGAIEATLLDLAARGHLELRQTGDDPFHTTVHPRRKDIADLTGYELQVLERVNALTEHGALPVTALAHRDPAEAEVWTKHFAAQVADDARARGLSKPRRHKYLFTLLAANLVGAAGVGVTMLRYLGDGTNEPGTKAWSAAILAFVALGALGRPPGGAGDTPAGRAVAAGWLGLQEHLRRDTDFAELPPAAVAIWDRYLAYGEAVGVTRTCDAVLDFGVGDGRRLWSHRGGGWRRIRVRHPVPVPYLGCATVDLALLAAVVFVPGAVLSAIGLAAGLPVLAFPGLVAVAAALYLAGGTLLSIRPPVPVTGQILWLRPWKRYTGQNGKPGPFRAHCLVVDDGRADRTTAWALPTELVADLAVGDVVTISGRRWSRRVDSIELVEAGRGRELAAVEARAAAAYEAARESRRRKTPRRSARRLFHFVSHATISETLGVPVTLQREPTPGMLLGVYVNEDGKPIVNVQIHTGGYASALMAARRRRRTPIPGIGDEAYAGRNWVAAGKGDWAVALDLRRRGRGIDRARLVRLLAEVVDELPD
jgi:hypothetical protein